MYSDRGQNSIYFWGMLIEKGHEEDLLDAEIFLYLDLDGSIYTYAP